VAIKFGGEFEVQRSPEEVYDFLTDPNRFAPLLPDFRGVTVQDAQNFTVKVNVGISYIKGVADVKMHLAESQRPQRAQYKGQGSVAGGNVNMVAGFDLAPAGSGTKVAWQGEAQVFGRLTSVAGGLLEPLGKKQLQKLIDGLRNALDGPASATASEASAPPAAGPSSAIENTDAPEKAS
jgi:carbon monoxide dehydrogenase subunit G